MSAIRFLEMTLVVRGKEQRLMMSLKASAGAKYSKSIWKSRREPRFEEKSEIKLYPSKRAI
jgi:hypothetical protein